jgi:DNA repair protein RadA/Sms
VLQRRARLSLAHRDVYVSTVGGARVVDPSADLAIAVAVASAAVRAAVPIGFVAIGEVGLAGELRRVPGVDRRLAEAARLGFTDAIVPADRGDTEQRVSQGLRLHPAPSIVHALAALRLDRAASHDDPPHPSTSARLVSVGGVGPP